MNKVKSNYLFRQVNNLKAVDIGNNVLLNTFDPKMIFCSLRILYFLFNLIDGAHEQ